MRNVKRKVYYVLFLIVCFAILIDCQGGGGSGRSRSHSRSHSRSYSGSSSRSGSGGCVGDDCGKFFLIFFAAITGVGLSIWGCYCCCHKRSGRPRENNSRFVNPNPSQQQYGLVRGSFQTGMWSSRYCQYQSWHGPHQLHLSFNPHSMAVNGSGWDDVGEFTIDGTYSDITQRMGLTKFYKKGTGDETQNLGHSVTIQVRFNAQSSRFEGKWYVETYKYQGEDDFELKFDE